MSFPRNAALAAGLGLCAAATTAHAQTAAPAYRISGLGSLGLAAVTPYAVNNLGQATGLAFLADGVTYHAFLSTPGAGMVDLGTMGGSKSQGNAINDRGDVVGTTFTTVGTGFNTQEFHTVGGVPQPLTDGANTLVDARGINNAGQIVATEDLAGGPVAVIIGPNGTVTALGSLGRGSQGNAISQSGVVGGSSVNAHIQTHAFVQMPGGGIIDLGSMDGTFANGLGVNNSEQVVGYVARASGLTHAFLAAPGVPIQDLGTLGGTESGANAINDAGQVVGEAYTPDNIDHAFLSNNGGPLVDLNSLIAPNSGWVLSSAKGISDTGFIVGTGTLNGVPTGFLLAPTPEPSALSALALGTFALTALALRARRRSS